jgi:sugar lactone lactonase YvrE
MSTYAGDGVAGYTTDIPPVVATTAKVNFPYSVATDAAGNVYIADYENNRIRKVNIATGTITTIAGTGLGAHGGDGGPATAAWIKWPAGMAFDAAGNMYFADFGNNVIRKINTSNIISTVAGIPGTLPAYTGDVGPATLAKLGNPLGVAIHPTTGDLLIADQLNHAIRKVNLTTGIITSIVGNGMIGVGAAGDGGLASAARLNEPTDIATDAVGNIYIADNGNNRIRKVSATTGIISTVAGIVAGSVPGSIYGYAGDGGAATAARFYYPKGIAVDGPGNIYIADWNNNVIRKVNTSGIVSTIAGTSTAAYAGDGGLAVAASINKPTDVAVRYDGDVFIADNENNRIRRIKIGNEPYFTAGATKTVTICPIEFTILDSALKVDDIDVGQTLSWSPVLLPSHGTLVATYSTSSTGSTVTPSGMQYAASAGYVGTDIFSVRVTDGTYSDTITINANVLAPIVAGTISGPDSVCPAQTIGLTSTVTGGTWSTSNANATVSASGIVTGVSAGTVVVSYHINHFCGNVYATKTVTVIATVPCVSNVVSIPANDYEISIAPNPNKGIFTLSVNTGKKETISIEIHDVTGRKVFHQYIPSGSDVPVNPTLPSGIYILNVVSSKQKNIRKLVVE